MGRRVVRTLPNGHAAPYLHEVAMDEAKFQRNEKQVRAVCISVSVWACVCVKLSTKDEVDVKEK